MNSVFLALVGRDLKLAARRRTEALLPLVFFIVAVGLFPLGVGPEPQTLRQIAPGIVWVCALLAGMLSVNQLYAGDLADGSLEQMLLAGQPLIIIAAARSLSHWLLTGLPLVLTAPLFAVMFDLTAEGLQALVLGLLLGTPVLSLLGNVGAALTLGLRGGGMLIILLVLPLTVPVLIFGTGAVGAVESGLTAQPAAGAAGRGGGAAHLDRMRPVPPCLPMRGMLPPAGNQGAPIDTYQARPMKAGRKALWFSLASGRASLDRQQ